MPSSKPEFDLERRTIAIGREIFADLDTSGPSVFAPKWWDDWLIDWSMANPQVKTQLFRFIDVLPMLESAESVAEHLREYFGDQSIHFPPVMRFAAGLADPETAPGRFLARLIRQNVARMARRFIAGADGEEVLIAVRRLRDEGMAFTLDLLGEATVSERESEEYQRQYLTLLDRLGPEAKRWPSRPILDRDRNGPIPRINMSLKLSALFSQFDPIDPAGTTRAVAERLRPIFRAARRNGAIVNLDMEQYAFKDLTLSIFESILSEPEFRDWMDVGIALQAYLRECPADLERLLSWVAWRKTPIWIRLVKGAYWDYETLMARQRDWPVPVYLQKWESDQCFERCCDFLFEHHGNLRPAIASHNVRTLAHALAVAERAKCRPGDYELQLLYGMAEPLQQSLVARGERVRIYAPFGKLLPGMAYLVRRLLENTSNASFLRATFTEKTPVDELLRSPIQIGKCYEQTEATMTQPARPNLSAFTNEALLDFSLGVEQERMRKALADVRGRFGRHDDLWIEGRPASTALRIESRNPADCHTIVGTVASATIDDVNRAVAAATRAAENWRSASVWRRADALFETARQMRERRYELAAWMVFECGKQWREADADVAEAIDFCEYYARRAIELSAPQKHNLPGEDNETSHLPRGVTVVIAPWNFPLAILCGMTMAPLVCGCPVILKPAEQSSVIAARFFEILRGVDLPDGVIGFLPGAGDIVGRRLVEHPDVAVINFTGSMAVGLEINQAANIPRPSQRHVKHVVAEMGGKNAIIVDEDADLDEAVRGTVASAFGYQGQKCSACSRVIVLSSVYDLFVGRLKDAIASLSIGPPEDPGFSLGPVIDEEAQSRLLAAIERGCREATLLFKGDVTKVAPNGYYVPPTLFADAAIDSFLPQTELFGPVLTVFRANDLAEALVIANATPYKLTGGLFSRNPATISRIRRDFLVGNLYINRKITGALVERQPFGGFGMSGTGGKAGGADYLSHFLIGRTITENTFRRGFAPE